MMDPNISKFQSNCPNHTQAPFNKWYLSVPNTHETHYSLLNPHDEKTSVIRDETYNLTTVWRLWVYRISAIEDRNVNSFSHQPNFDNIAHNPDSEEPHPLSSKTRRRRPSDPIAISSHGTTSHTLAALWTLQSVDILASRPGEHLIIQISTSW